MTESVAAVQDTDDANLLRMVRAGSAEAFSALCDRHLAAARRLARLLVSPPAAADEVVAETFARILEVTRAGGGPANAVRPYVLTAVRRVSSERLGGQPVQPSTGDRQQPDLGEPFIDPVVSGVENALLTRAYLSLPERWRAILWHTQIEQASPAEIGPILGLTRNGVVALSDRALDGLRQAYLRAHLTRITQPACRPVLERLGGYLRNTLSVRDTALVAEHVARCEWCPVVLQELNNVDEGLCGVVAPLILGSAAADYLTLADSSPPFGSTAPLPEVSARRAAPALSPGRHAAPMGGRVLGTVGGAAASGRGGNYDGDPPEPTPRDRRPPRRPRRPPRRGRATALAVGVVLAVAGASAMAFALTGNGKAPARAVLPPSAAPSQPAVITQPPPSASPRTHPSASPSAPAQQASPPGPAPTANPTTAPPAGVASLGASISIQRQFQGPDQVVIQAINSGSAATGAVTASVTFPTGVSLDPGNPPTGGWNCQPTQAGETCTHSAIGVNQSAEETIFVNIGSTACGMSVQLTVTSGNLRAFDSRDVDCGPR